MKFLALEVEIDGVDDDAFEPLLKDEARRVLELYQDGVVREIYFRDDKPLAVIVLECESIEEANEALGSLPLVREGLIKFEVIPLKPYPGWGRLMDG